MLAAIDINGLSVFAELGLVLFLGVFVAVTVRALRAPRGEISSCARLHLDEAEGADGAAQERRVAQ